MISNKNIDDVLKERIFEDTECFFRNNKSVNERAEFLKKKYGIGGWAIPQRGDFIDYVYYNRTGIRMSKSHENNGTETIKLSWKKVAERIEKIFLEEDVIQLSLF